MELSGGECVVLHKCFHHNKLIHKITFDAWYQKQKIPGAAIKISTSLLTSYLRGGKYL